MNCDYRASSDGRYNQKCMNIATNYWTFETDSSTLYARCAAHPPPWKDRTPVTYEEYLILISLVIIHEE